MSSTPIIIWFRKNLRLHDNPPLQQASTLGGPLLLTYIHDENKHKWSRGEASQWYLRESLLQFNAHLEKRFNASLIFQKGNPLHCLLNMAKTTHAKTVYWDSLYEPYHLQFDQEIKLALESEGLVVKIFNTSLLQEPTKIFNQANQSFKVFTPFCRKLKTLPIRDIYPVPQKFSVFNYKNNLSIDELFPLPTIPWHKKIAAVWCPGEIEARKKLKNFLTKKLPGYKLKRDRPDLSHTSLLSPHLHFGEISPIQIWHATLNKQYENPSLGEDVDCFLSELVWREFSYYLLYHFPQLPDKPIKNSFENYPWKSSPSLLSRWQKGLTGYPIIDAGMQQLWQTGWMHNRVRMIVASFLIKDLHQPWQDGEGWFWNTLVDADLANNAASWQWVAGCGVDAAPFFRIFNPVTQGKKFDPNGNYVKKWLPQLRDLDIKYLHTPWLAPEKVLKEANIILGKTYPLPIVDHDKERQYALKNYKNLK